MSHNQQRLTTFEEYMLLDDRPRFPMTYFLRLDFQSTPDRSRLEIAWRHVLSRHPLLCCRVESHRGRPVWSLAPELIPSIDWETPWTDDAPPRPATPNIHTPKKLAKIDLTSGTGLRLYAHEQGDFTRLLLQVHHSCVDGIGMVQMIAEILTIYDGLSAGLTIDEIPLPAFDERLLDRRGRLGLTAWWWMTNLCKQLSGVDGVWRFLRRTAVPLSTRVIDANAPESPVNYPSIVQHRLSVEQTQRLITRAKSSGNTLSELLLADLHCAVRDWMHRQPGMKDWGERWVRIALPINMRRDGMEKMSVTNVASMVFFDRREHETNCPESLLQGIACQLRRIKRRSLGYLFLWGLTGKKLLPGGLRRAVDDQQHPVSAVLSNLGRAFDALSMRRDEQNRILTGNLTLDGICFVPPIRHNTYASFGVVTCGNRLTLNLLYDQEAIKPTEAAQLMQGFTERLRSEQS